MATVLIQSIKLIIIQSMVKPAARVVMDKKPLEPGSSGRPVYHEPTSADNQRTAEENKSPFQGWLTTYFMLLQQLVDNRRTD